MCSPVTVKWAICQFKNKGKLGQVQILLQRLGKNLPILYLRVPSNDPRNNYCRTHFISFHLIISKVGNMFCMFNIFCVAVMHLSIGSLSNDDGNGIKNGNKLIWLDWQNNNFAHASCFFVHFFAIIAQLQHENA